MAKSPKITPDSEFFIAAELISDFDYRDQFKMTQQELLNEPLESYIINKKIMASRADRQERESKANSSKRR